MYLVLRKYNVHLPVSLLFFILLVSLVCVSLLFLALPLFLLLHVCLPPVFKGIDLILGSKFIPSSPFCICKDLWKVTICIANSLH
jgi:hypothetical protein